MAAPTMSREQWVEAALAALVDQGPEALAVEPLAAKLGVSKGSFYWHFTNRADLVEATLDRFREVSTTAIIERNEAGGGSAAVRLRRLFDVVVDGAARYPGDIVLMTGTAPALAQVRQEVTAQRVAYVADLLIEAGAQPAQARQRAVLAYAAYLGFAQLAASAPSVIGRHRKSLLNTLAELLVHDERAVFPTARGENSPLED